MPKYELMSDEQKIVTLERHLSNYMRMNNEARKELKRLKEVIQYVKDNT